MGKLSNLKNSIMEKLFPATPQEYRASLFDESDAPRFQTYIDAKDRRDDLITKAAGFTNLLAVRRQTAMNAAGAFNSTLTPETFAAMQAAARDLAECKVIEEINPGFVRNGGRDFAADTFAGEYPKLADEMADLLEWMRERFQADLERIRPLEATRLAAVNEGLQAYGMGGEDQAPIEERSVVVKNATAYLQRLSADIARLRQPAHARGAFQVAPDPLAVAGTYVEPVLNTLPESVAEEVAA